MKIKILSLAFFALFLNHAFSQEGFIINKDGEKIIVDNSSVELSFSSDEFEYKQPGSDKKSKINFDKIKSADLGDYRVETFIIDKKKPRPYFIIAEIHDKKLVGYNETITHYYGPTQSKSSSVVKYSYFILDANNNLMETLKLSNEEDKEDAEAILAKYFSDCPALVRRANALREIFIKAGEMPNAPRRFKKTAEKLEGQEVRFSPVFVKPYYSKCDEPTTDNSEKSSAETPADLSQYDGTYQFESFSMSKPIKIDKVMKGTFIIKDGKVDIQAKGYNVSYKITNIKDGMIYLEDKSMVHVLKIEPEAGKKKGVAYDTKILFTADKAMGSIAEYWCTKG